MMERQIAQSFNEQVDAYIDDEIEKEILYAALRRYQSNRDLTWLISDLKEVLNEPLRMYLYEEIRPLIPLKHQMQYDALVPPCPSHRLRIVRLKRRHHEGLGFAVRGGLEHGVGLYVSHVLPDSQAYKQGLRIGDEIVRVNGFTINQAIHEEVLNLIKAKLEIILKVRSIGMLPIKEKSDQKLSWKYVESDDVKPNSHESGHKLEEGVSNGSVGQEIKLYISVPVSSGLGCSICSGPEGKPGIYIQSIKVGSLAEEAGLEVGDQIIEVNGTSFHNIKHSEAVVALKGSRHLDITLKKGAGTGIFLHRNRSDFYDLEDDSSVELTQALGTRERLQLLSPDNDNDLINPDLGSTSSMVHSSQVNVIQNGHHTRTPGGSIIQEDIHSGTLIRENGYSRQLQNWKSSDDQRLGELRVDTGNSSWVSQRHEFQHDKLHDHQHSEDSGHHSVSPPSGHDLSSTWSGGYWRNDLQDDQHGHSGSRSHSDDLSISYSRTMQGPTYMSAERAPSFRFQKPVLLSPIDAKKRTSTGSSYKAISEDGNADTISLGGFNPYRVFTNEQIDGRQIGVVTIKKNGCEDLGLLIETTSEGNETGNVIVSEVYEGGAIHKQGGIHVGDQIMMVDGTCLLDVHLTQAYTFIKNSFRSSHPTMKLVVAKALPGRQDEEVMPHPRPDYSDSLPTSNLDDYVEDVEGHYDVCAHDVPITII